MLDYCSTWVRITRRKGRIDRAVERGHLKEHRLWKGWNPEHRRGFGLLGGSGTPVLLRVKGMGKHTGRLIALEEENEGLV